MAVFNPFDQNLFVNPYPVYKALREEDPVHWNQIMQVWILTRYDDVVMALRDYQRFSADRTISTNPYVQQLETIRMNSGPIGRSPTMLTIDPPAHTRMRNLVNKAFTPRVVERIRPHIQEIASNTLDELPDPNNFDLLTDLAVPLPIVVIAELLGVPPADRAQFKAWSSDIAGGLGGPFQPAGSIQRAQRSSNEIADYFRGKIAERRHDPQDDLLTALISAEEQGDLLDEDELVATLILLLVAGNETTTNLIANGMLGLMRNPDQYQLLRSQPDLIDNAIEEMLRYDGPAQITSRVATGDMELRGKQVLRGQVMLVALGAANHDPEQFENPDDLDIRRPPSRHMGFGYGIHYCVGAPLALAEATIGFQTLLQRLPNLELAGEPGWGSSFVLRGLKHLKVKATT